MKEVLAGVVASCQPHHYENLPDVKPRLLLRATKEWTTAIIVGAKIKGFDYILIPKGTHFAILIEELPELDILISWE